MKKYKKPEIKKVELIAEEALVTGCKLNGNEKLQAAGGSMPCTTSGSVCQLIGT